MKQVSGVIRANGKTFFLKDNSTITDADAIIYSTGYLYNSSFINDSVVYERNDTKKISPLYNDVISAKFPTMAFIALRKANNFFTAIYTQVFKN